MAARLGQACRQERRRAGLRMIDVAVEAGTSESTIHNFERGNGWRRETDAIVAAYATLCKTTERELWQRALGR